MASSIDWDDKVRGCYLFAQAGLCALQVFADGLDWAYRGLLVLVSLSLSVISFGRLFNSQDGVYQSSSALSCPWLLVVGATSGFIVAVLSFSVSAGGSAALGIGLLVSCLLLLQLVAVSCLRHARAGERQARADPPLQP